MEKFGPPNSPDVSDEQQASDALIRLIRKWRWMGMDDEVERVEKTLTARELQRTDTVLAGPSDTD